MIASTAGTLTGFPDGELHHLNVAWSGDEDAGFYTSHLGYSRSTNLGWSAWGPPTGKRLGIRFAADCISNDNLIHTEWLVRDNGAAVRQLGLDVLEVATAIASAPAAETRVLSAPTRLLGQAPRAPVEADETTPEGFARVMFDTLWNRRRLDKLERYYGSDIVCHAGGGRVAVGLRNLSALILQVLTLDPGRDDGGGACLVVRGDRRGDPGGALAAGGLHRPRRRAGRLSGRASRADDGDHPHALLRRRDRRGVDDLRRGGRARGRAAGMSGFVFDPARQAPWDADPQVLSPVGRALDEVLAERPRRQALGDGFEPVYSDIVDYILRCTHRIWEEKNVGLCRTHYADSCVMHTLNGPARGLDAVVQGTVGTLAAYADRIVVGEEVIWSEDAPGLYHSSHRIMSRSTHAGDDPQFGPATGRVQGAVTVADCLVKDNLIVEEWLVRDNARAAVQLGLEPWDIARAQAEADGRGDPARHEWRADWIAAVRDATPTLPPDEHPAHGPAKALATAFVDDNYGLAAQACSPAVEVRWPTNRQGWGRGAWIGCLMQLRSLLHKARFRLDHWCARPLPGGTWRWRCAGRWRASTAASASGVRRPGATCWCWPSATTACAAG